MRFSATGPASPPGGNGLNGTMKVLAGGATLLALLGGFGTVLYRQAVEHGDRISRLESDVETLKRQNDRMDLKLDKLLDRLK